MMVFLNSSTDRGINENLNKWIAQDMRGISYSNEPGLDFLTAYLKTNTVH